MKDKKFLLLAIVVLLALASSAILYPALIGGFEKNRQIKDINKINQLGGALLIYANNDNNGGFPKSLDKINISGLVGEKWYNDHKDKIEYFPNLTMSDNSTNVLLRLKSESFPIEFRLNGSVSSVYFPTNSTNSGTNH